MQESIWRLVLIQRSASVQEDFMRKGRDVFDGRVGHVLEQWKDKV